MLQYARLLVEMQLAGPFPEFIEFANEKEDSLRMEAHQVHSLQDVWTHT